MITLIIYSATEKQLNGIVKHIVPTYYDYGTDDSNIQAKTKDFLLFERSYGLNMSNELCDAPPV